MKDLKTKIEKAEFVRCVRCERRLAYLHEGEYYCDICEDELDEEAEDEDDQ